MKIKKEQIDAIPKELRAIIHRDLLSVFKATGLSQLEIMGEFTLASSANELKFLADKVPYLFIRTRHRRLIIACYKLEESPPLFAITNRGTGWKKYHKTILKKYKKWLKKVNRP